MSNLVVQTNVLALNSHRNLKTVGVKTSQASARLSSGYRINSAADDASGLAISEKMRAQIRGLDMASKNTQDGISLVQTAEGGMQEVDNMVQRIRELAVQASNDTNDAATKDRQKIQDEIEQLTQGIDSLAGQVEFNAKKLLDGSLLDSGTKAALIGEVAGKVSDLIGKSNGSAIADDSASGELGKIFATAKNVFSGAAIAATDGPITAAALAVMSSQNVSDEAALNKYVDKVNNYLAAKTVSNTGATDADKADAQKAIDAARAMYSGLQEVAAYNKSIVALGKTNGDGLWFQTGANSNQGIQVGIGSIKTDILGIGGGAGGSSIDVTKDSGADITAFIDIVDNALQYVTSQRAKLGAVQNRMEYTKSSLDISSENLSASESRIRDADMAKEMMKMTSANVLQQAGVSMLSQANQAPQSVLQLLG